MLSKVRYAQYKQVVDVFRQQTGHEVTTYALKHSHAELIGSRKTALTQRIEKHFKRPIEDIVLARKLDLERVHSAIESRVQGVNYGDADFIEKVLDPSQNALCSKRQTYRLALSQGYKYVIVECNLHGNTLHRATARKRGINVDGLCCICRAELTINNKERRIKEINAVVEHFKKLKPSAVV